MVIYDIDIFMFLISFIEKVIGFKYGFKYGCDVKLDMVMWVIFDYIWVVFFIIVDGQLFDNGGVGYVICWILCCVVCYYYFFFNVKEFLLYKLVLVLVKEMGESFFELKVQEQQIVKIIESEEKIFFNILENGLKCFVLLDIFSGIILGMDVFELYDIFGFLIDLICLLVCE